MVQVITPEAFRDEWLEDVRAGDPSTTVLGHRFARKLLAQWRDLDDASDDLVYCDGAGDGGIDIAYLHRAEAEDPSDEPVGEAEGDTWYLVQGKYGAAFQGSGTLLAEAQKVVDTLDGRRQRLSSLAEGLLERLTQFRAQSSERDRIVLVFATVAPLNEEQKRTLGDVRAMGRQRLGTLFDVESVSVETIYLRALEDPGTQPRVRVPVLAAMADSGPDLLVGSITLLNLYAFLKAYREQTEDLDQLYEKNVRRFLGIRGKVNKAMQQTLQETPERFGLYNNGITIVVHDFARGAGGTVELVEPYVVNGCQTTRTIWEVCHKRLEAGGTGTDPVLNDWRQRAGLGVVVAKVVKVGDEGEAQLQQITRYTNTQNAVREKDFLTLTSDFRTWARQAEERYGVYLEIQRGGWESRRARQRQDPQLRQLEEYANAFDLLKVYGAGWLGEAGVAFGSNKAFLPNGAIFRRILGDGAGGETFGVDDLYAAYRLQRAADAYHFGRSAQLASRRQTRFLYYMVAMNLLRDVLIRAGGNPTPKDLTKAVLRLFDPGQEAARGALLDSAIEIIDEYLTRDAEDSLFAEPALLQVNSDLNAFLKWEQLGKSKEATPRLHALITGYQRTMGRRSGGQPAPRDLILGVVAGP